MNKLISYTILLITLFLMFTTKVNAACVNDPMCNSDNRDDACSNNQICLAGCCVDSGSGGGGGGGGGGSCTSPGTGINCPTGTVKGTTLVSSACWRGSYCPGAGTAQEWGSCCNWVQPPQECGDWYSCPTYNKPNKVCRDCSQEPAYCVERTIRTYDCVSPCGSTAPSNIAYDDPTDLLTWTVGANSTSQKLYVSANLSEAQNGCPGLASPSCVVNEVNLSASTSSYSIPNLSPVTEYFVFIENYNSDTCKSTIVDSFTTPLPNDPWWQVKDGDVTTTGDISSTVPNNGSLFSIVGLGGFPGIPVYGSLFNLTDTESLISTTMWNANTITTTSRLFDYAYFENLIPSDATINNIGELNAGTNAISDLEGYEWYVNTGSLTVSSDIDFGSRKVILFVEGGDLNIDAKINLTDNSGFFAVFVDGNININPTVVGSPSLEGLYLSDLSFNTGAGTSQMHLRGSVVSYGGFGLARDLTDNSIPAELLEYAPDQILLFPEKLGYRGQKWVEVAP